MSYGRDYGNRNFLDRAAGTVRGWFGHRGHEYDDGYRGAPMGRGWNEGRGGYREMGDVSGYRGWEGGMEHGYGSTNWTGRNADWNRGFGSERGGWGRGGGEGYRTGGYQPHHDAWDVDWEDRTLPQGGMRHGGMMGGMPGGMSGGMMGGMDRYDRGYRDPRERMMGGGMQGGMGGGMAGRGGMPRGMHRGYDRDTGGEWNRPGGMGYGPGMPGSGSDLGDVGGGTIGNYGAYGGYGLERFRSGNNGGVPIGQYWTGYGHGSGYRG